MKRRERTPKPKRIAIFERRPRGQPRDGQHGAALIPTGARIMTHCNAGALATSGHGTALGVIRIGARMKKGHFRDRQRNAALPAGRAPHRLGMRAGRHSLHADHRQHGRPPDEHGRGRRWSSSAPTASPPTATPRTRSAPTCSRCWRSATASRSTSRRRCPPSISKIADGSAIPIEERAGEEVTGYRGVRWAPEGVQVRNPAFDVTPAELITAIVCEKGVILKPDRERILDMLA